MIFIYLFFHALLPCGGARDQLATSYPHGRNKKQNGNDMKIKISTHVTNEMI